MKKLTSVITMLFVIFGMINSSEAIAKKTQYETQKSSKTNKSNNFKKSSNKKNIFEKYHEFTYPLEEPEKVLERQKERRKSLGNSKYK